MQHGSMRSVHLLPATYGFNKPCTAADVLMLCLARLSTPVSSTEKMSKPCAGAITTLGRGGSDLTATLIGAALHVPEVQVWKDVDGAPPRCMI